MRAVARISIERDSRFDFVYSKDPAATHSFNILPTCSSPDLPCTVP
jgi:hypothetical protein